MNSDTHKSTHGPRHSIARSNGSADTRIFSSKPHLAAHVILAVISVYPEARGKIVR